MFTFFSVSNSQLFSRKNKFSTLPWEIRQNVAHDINIIYNPKKIFAFNIILSPKIIQMYEIGKKSLFIMFLIKNIILFSDTKNASVGFIQQW